MISGVGIGRIFAIKLQSGLHPAREFRMGGGSALTKCFRCPTSDRHLGSRYLLLERALTDNAHCSYSNLRDKSSALGCECTGENKRQVGAETWILLALPLFLVIYVAYMYVRNVKAILLPLSPSRFTFRTKCDMNLRAFPFDTQFCEVHLESCKLKS